MDTKDVRFSAGRYKGWLVRLAPEEYLRSLDLDRLKESERVEVERVLAWWEEDSQRPSVLKLF